MSETVSNRLESEQVDMTAIQNSCRWPLLTLFCGAGVWLLAAAVFGLIASIKMHSPAFLADCAWLTYGRVHAIAHNSLLYGFASQLAFAIAFWLVAVLGRAPMKHGVGIWAAAKVWNLAVLVGVIGILIGDSTGYAALEFPRYASGILFVAAVSLSLLLLLNFHCRNVRELYPSFWFLIAGVFWLVWIYSTAQLLLNVFEVRGVLQAAVQGWFEWNLISIWLLPVAIAVLLYWIPALTGGELKSGYLNHFIFWTLAFFAPWGGITAGVPLPSWVSAASNGALALILMPVLALILNLSGCLLKKAESASVSIRFFQLAALSILVWALLVALNTTDAVLNITRFTLVGPALEKLVLLGGIASALFGAVYHLLPGLTSSRFVLGRWSGIHLLVHFVAVLFLVAPPLLGGIRQGFLLNNPEVPFAEVMSMSAMPLRMSSVGDLLLLVSGALFVFITFKAVTLECLGCCRSFCSEWCVTEKQVKSMEAAS